MRSSFAAFLFGFTLPFGRTSGRRIVFNGPDALIAFYDSADVLRIQIGGPGGHEDEIQLFSGDAAEVAGGFVFTEIQGGGGGDRNLLLTLFSPTPSGQSACRLQVRSESIDGTELPSVNIDPVSASQVELSLATKVLGRGILARDDETANSGAFGDLSVTALAITNLEVIAGHTYRFWLHTQYAISAVASTWIFTLNVNTVVTERFHTDQNQSAVAKTGFVNAFVDWVAPASGTTDDFAVGVDETTATAATLTLNASASVRSSFSVEDLGIL